MMYSDFHKGSLSCPAVPEGPAARQKRGQVGRAPVFVPGSPRAPESILKIFNFGEVPLDRRIGTGYGNRGDGRKIKRPT
jgi:hypothetical protein